MTSSSLTQGLRQGAAMPDQRLTEDALARAWDGRLYAPDPLRTVEGVPVQVVHPGRRNTDSGPDFLDALLVFGDGPLRRGDVEVHLRTADWFAHGHAGDPAYQGVILHVVAHAGSHVTLNQAPVLELPPLEDGRAPSLAVSPHRPTEEELEAWGEARLEARAAALEGEIAAVGAEQALYGALLGGLGYSKNVAPFQEVAGRAPFNLLRDVAQSAPSRGLEHETLIAGLLFGTAGLLPSQRGIRPRDGSLGLPVPDLPAGESDSPAGRSAEGVPIPTGRDLAAPLLDGYTRAVEEAWRWMGSMAPLPSGSWRTFRVRPANHPVRRMGGAVALAMGWLRDDLVERLRRAVMEGTSPRASGALVVKVLSVGAEGYWARHRDFGVPRRDGPLALIGQGRAREMAVSAALPFLLALADWDRDGRLESGVRAVYAVLPSPPANALARWAEDRLPPAEGDQQGRTPGGTRMAVRQQGLLHLVKGGL